MQVVLRLLAGAVGLIIGWFLTGMVAINMTEPRDVGDVFVAFVIIGPIGGLVGLGVALWLLKKVLPAREREPRP